jgi:HSP20 family protein
MTKPDRVSLIRYANATIKKNRDPFEAFILPASDIYEMDDAYVVQIDMPGVKRDSIHVYVTGDRIGVKGSKNPSHRKEAKLLFNELQTASYYREFNIGNGVKHESIEATYADGVLTLRLPKRESMRVREIPVN